MKYIYIFIIGLCIISLIYLIYILYQKHFTESYTEHFNEFQYIDIKQNILSIKDLPEITINNNTFVDINNITDTFNEELLKTNLLKSSLQNIIIEKTSSTLNQYKITFNQNNKSLSMKHDSTSEILTYSSYINNNSNHWQIDVITYNANYPNNNFENHIISIKSYIDLELCLSETQNGSFKLVKCDKNNKAQQFIYKNGQLKNVGSNNVMTINSTYQMIESEKSYNNYIIGKNGSNLYNLSYDKSGKMTKAKFNSLKVLSLSQYKNGKIVMIDDNTLNTITEIPNITFSNIIQQYLNNNKIGDDAIIKKKTTNNYYLIVNELINDTSILKKKCFTQCSSIITNNNLDSTEDIYARNLNDSNKSVYVIDDDIVNAIELSGDDIISYKEVVEEELNKFFKLYDRSHLLYNDKILIIKKNNELFKKKINNVTALNLYKHLYDKNNDYFTLPFKYDINKLYDIIQDYVQNYNPLIGTEQDPNYKTNEHIESESNIYKLFDDENPEILTIKFILYDKKLLGESTQNKFKQLIIKSDKSNYYLLSVNKKNKYVKSKFNDKQHLELAFYSKILSKDDILLNNSKNNDSYYILAETEINKLAPSSIPEYYPYKAILANIWSIDDNLHFNRRDKLLESDKYVDTYSKVIDIDKEKNNENYYLKILTYDMYKSLLLSNKELKYRDKTANTDLNNNVYDDGQLNINKDYYTLNEFLLQVMNAQPSNIVSNNTRDKFLEIEILTTENIKVKLLQNSVNKVHIILNDALFKKLNDDYRH